MIRTFRDCDITECENFDPESQHGHFDEEIELRDVGKLASKCEGDMTDVREELKGLRQRYKQREGVWEAAVSCIESLRSILGVPSDDSINSAEFIDAAKRLKCDREQYEELWRHATTIKGGPHVAVEQVESSTEGGKTGESEQETRLVWLPSAMEGYKANRLKRERELDVILEEEKDVGWVGSRLEAWVKKDLEEFNSAVGKGKVHFVRVAYMKDDPLKAVSIDLGGGSIVSVEAIPPTGETE